MIQVKMDRNKITHKKIFKDASYEIKLNKQTYEVEAMSIEKFNATQTEIRQFIKLMPSSPLPPFKIGRKIKQNPTLYLKECKPCIHR